MKYIESPEVYDPTGATSVFLAGGITNCPDWQKEMVRLLQHTDLTLLNPRRKKFPIHDPNAAEGQITWEYQNLRTATAIMFWFPCETLCPIVLYELGAWTMTKKRIFVGVHPDYSRRADVEIQTRLAKQDIEFQTQLARPSVKVVYSLKDLAQQVQKWERQYG